MNRIARLRRRVFGASVRFWLNLQTAYELALAERELGEKIAAEVSPAVWPRRAFLVDALVERVSAQARSAANGRAYIAWRPPL